MRILIVEDEPLIARRLQRMLQDLLPEADITGVASLPAGLEFLDRHPIDLLFLDLNLGGEDGFQLLQTLTAGAFQTVIVSAHTERAIDAFAYGVLDFVPKPFDRERLEKALRRYTTAPVETSARYLTVRRRAGLFLVPVDDIRFIKGAGSYSEIHHQAVDLHDKNLDALSRILPPRFERVHKSYLVNMDEVKQLLVQSGSQYDLLLKDGTRIPVGRTRYKDFREKWG
ncbi:MAG: response regulator transcription factor [Siphonobacter aquaeclarae]|nr:response regulator transcription factor [Siphonobacter aquaeclarae]